MYSTPFIINEQNETEQYQRVSFGSGFTEQWLQERLFENPDSLPLVEIDPAYQNAVPLCMEMNTGVGPIDIVYITPQGRLVIIETKLWRNPEARRKVIGQALDYAKELKRWSYSDLQREVSRRTDIKGNSPYKIVSARFPEVDEAVFVDGITQSLQRGDFMLIVAGDGIRRNAQGIVQFLEEVAHMQFVLAMIEIAVFKHNEKNVFIVQPRTQVQTQTVSRKTEISYSSETLAATEEEKNGIDPWREQYKNFWTDVLANLTLDDPEQPMANPVAMGNITFSLPPSGAVAWITVYFYKQNKNVGCFLRLINKPIGHELYQSLLEEKESIESDLPFKVTWEDKNRIIDRYMHIDGEWPPVNDKQVKSFLAETINGMINTFRPRLKRLSGN